MIGSPRHIVLTGGGTGGHLMPGIAIAEQLRRDDPNVRLTFAGDGQPWQRACVESVGADYLPLACRALPRRWRDAPRFARDEIQGYVAARRFLGRESVDLVVGLGGFASVPMSLAAVHAGVPLILHEQNAVPGKATCLLARRATAVCLGFGQAADRLPRDCPIHVTGTPVRRAFFSRTPLGGDRLAMNAREPDVEPQLLVLGGSNGAAALNQSVPEALAILRRGEPGLSRWRIVHQAGEKNVDAVARRYALEGISARVVGRIGEMPSAMHCSDLAVSRAGGTTLAELAAAGLPAVLVPYPHAADEHQRANAVAFGAPMVDECQPDQLSDTLPLVHRLATTLGPMMLDARRRVDESNRLRRLGLGASAAEAIPSNLLAGEGQRS